MSQPPKPGRHTGIPFAEYQQWDAINSSFLWTLKTRSPLHAKWRREHPREDTPALLFGRALHSYVLEPTTWDETWAVCPPCDRRTKAGKATYAEFEATLGGREPLKADQYEAIVAMANAVRAQQCRHLISGGTSEVSLVWEDPETGLLCKGRLDYERDSGWDHFICDVKTTEDASEWGFAASIARFGYYQAAAFYCDGWQALKGTPSEFVWLAVEKSPPYVTKVWQCDEQTMAAGRNSYRQALRTAAECLKTGLWPAFGENSEMIDAPEWLLRREGVGPYNMRPEHQPAGGPSYAPGEEPEHDEIDDFLKGD